jgi:ECF transporter S component (folate family)
MNEILLMLKDNFHSLKQTKVIVGVSLFCALYVALSSFNIYLTSELRITFGYLAVAVSCYFYGPYPNVIAAFITDFLGYILHPDGPYFPGFAINAMIQALIYSLLFYKQKNVSIPRIMLARLGVVVICNLILNPIWLNILYGNSLWALISARLLKNIILYPIDCFLLFMILKLCQKIRVRTPFLAA